MDIFEEDITVSNTTEEAFAVIRAVPVVEVRVIGALFALCEVSGIAFSIDETACVSVVEAPPSFVSSDGSGIIFEGGWVRQHVVASVEEASCHVAVGESMFHCSDVVGHDVKVVGTG